MGHFIDDRAGLVTDAIDGLLAASDGALARLDGYPEIRVVLRAEPAPDTVAVVSGGGSGHEPAHAGFDAGADGPEACAPGIARLREAGGAGPADRTALDALIPAIEALSAGAHAAAKAARAGAEATAAMERAGTGRSSYLASADLAGHPDPGAVAVALAFEAWAGAAN